MATNISERRTSGDQAELSCWTAPDFLAIQEVLTAESNRANSGEESEGYVVPKRLGCLVLPYLLFFGRRRS